MYIDVPESIQLATRDDRQFNEHIINRPGDRYIGTKIDFSK